MIWNEKIECASRDEMTAVQSERLIQTVKRIYHNIPSYRAKMQEVGLLPGDIKTVEDLRRLPFTNKTDLRDNYPFGMFTVPMSEIVRVHASSGTTGKPTVVGYTRNDLQMWTDVVTRTLCMAGVHKNDMVQVAYGYGLFTGGLGMHYGTENLGATVIPISGGNTKKQIQLMQDFRTSVIACTPSYALFLAEVMQEMEIAPKNLKLRIGIFGAEPWSESMRKEIEAKLKLKAIDIYGLSEIVGPGVSCECECQAGMHVNEDHFIPEIIHPETLDPMAPGEIGELVFTTVTKEGIPVIRYRTRDLTRLIYDKCECGRTLVRMEKCKGRSDDMLIIRGVNVFPSQIESVLQAEITRQLAKSISEEIYLEPEGVGFDGKAEEDYAAFLASTFEKHMTKKTAADIGLLLVKHYLKEKVLEADEYERQVYSCWNGVWVNSKDV